MIYRLLLAALVLVCTVANSEARQRHRYVAAHPDCNILWPCEGVVNHPRGEKVVKAMGGLGSPQKVYRQKVAKADYRHTIKKKAYPRHYNVPEVTVAHSYGAPSHALAKPARYIAGRLKCAVNVGVALAERGLTGTGSAWAKSYDTWGRASHAQPGAVAVTDRRGGGHVAIVSRVEGRRVFVWNPSPRGQGWREVEYTNRRARYRVAS